MAPRKRKDSSDEIAGDEVQIIAADYSLKKRIGENLDLRVILSAENIESVQQVVTRYQKDFIIWVEKDMTTIMQSLRYTEQNLSKSIPYITKMKKAAFAIKSQAGTFGFDLASKVARSLEMFCEKDFRYEEGQLVVLRKHVETLRTILSQQIGGDGGQMGKDVMSALDALIEKYR
jgi:hypothetical protein